MLSNEIFLISRFQYQNDLVISPIMYAANVSFFCRKYVSALLTISVLTGCRIEAEWRRHASVNKTTSVADNHLLPFRHQAIILTKAGLLLIDIWKPISVQFEALHNTFIHTVFISQCHLQKVCYLSRLRCDNNFPKSSHHACGDAWGIAISVIVQTFSS